MTALSTDLKKEVDSRSSGYDVSQCRVCQKGYDGSQHFGIEICRACAAFFRRAVEGRKKFACRKGGDRCQLNTLRKVTCQKCRFIKCLKVGLQPELVQCKRPICEDPSSYPEFKDDASSTSDETTQPKVSFDVVPVVSFSSDSNILRPIPTANPVYSVDSPTPRPNLIRRVLCNYRKMYDERCAMELETPGCEGAPTFCSVGKVFSLISLTRLSTIMRKQLSYISQFIHETFDDYDSFDSNDQQTILQLFMTCFWELEGSYWTYRNLPAQDIEKTMVTLTTYSDLNNLEYLIMDKEPQDISLLKEVITSLQRHLRTTLINQMRSFILSEVEFVALLTLSLWSQRNLRGHDKAESVASNYRAQIFYDLHEHYRWVECFTFIVGLFLVEANLYTWAPTVPELKFHGTLPSRFSYNVAVVMHISTLIFFLFHESRQRAERKMDNYANRFGTLMCLFVDVQLNATRIGEDIELLKLFNMYNVDAFVYECMKGVKPPPTVTQ